MKFLTLVAIVFDCFEAAINLGVKLYPKYHPKAFSHKRKCYNCCDGLGITNRGCKDSAYKQENIPTGKNFILITIKNQYFVYLLIYY